MSDARMVVMQALMKLMGSPQMPPAQPMFQFGINVAPHPEQEPRPPMTPSVSVRG